MDIRIARMSNRYQSFKKKKHFFFFGHCHDARYFPSLNRTKMERFSNREFRRKKSAPRTTLAQEGVANKSEPKTPIIFIWIFVSCLSSEQQGRTIPSRCCGVVHCGTFHNFRNRRQKMFFRLRRVWTFQFDLVVFMWFYVGRFGDAACCVRVCVCDVG